MMKEGMVLYHGSYAEVITPDIGKCRAGKDFGKGFYVTTDKNQAKRFVKNALLKAKSEGLIPGNRYYGFVCAYHYSEIKQFEVFQFSDMDRSWLHCVVAHRRNRSLPGERKKWMQYDVIGGKIANDFTNAVITTYLNGGYGEVGSESADQIAIGLLEPDKLKDQYCFRTATALKNLVFLKSERATL